MAVAERRESVRSVLLSITVRANAHEGAVEQRYHRGQDLRPRQPEKGQIAADRPADRGERASELGEPVELRLVALGAPLLVIAILPAPFRVTSHRLQMPVRVGADPDIAPGRWNHQPADARKRRIVANGRTGRIDIA